MHRFLKLSTSAVPLPHHFGKLSVVPPPSLARLTNLDRRLQDSTNASAFDRARLEQEVKRAEQAEVDRKRLVNLTRRVQDEADVSAARRTRLEQEVEKLQDRLAAAAISPALYAKVLSARPFMVTEVPFSPPLQRDKVSASDGQSTVRIACVPESPPSR